jgi:hypothetical protein
VSTEDAEQPGKAEHAHAEPKPPTWITRKKKDGVWVETGRWTGWKPWQLIDSYADGPPGKKPEPEVPVAKHPPLILDPPLTFGASEQTWTLSKYDVAGKRVFLDRHYDDPTSPCTPGPASWWLLCVAPLPADVRAHLAGLAARVAAL